MVAFFLKVLTHPLLNDLTTRFAFLVTGCVLIRKDADVVDADEDDDDVDEELGFSSVTEKEIRESHKQSLKKMFNTF